MGEGFGDYLAASFFETLKPARFARCVGSWDATAYSPEDPPNLRRLDSTKRYPRDIVHEVHADGEIWSASLWALREAIGRTACDKLVLAHHFLLKRDSTFEEAALSLILADQQLFRGAHAGHDPHRVRPARHPQARHAQARRLRSLRAHADRATRPDAHTSSVRPSRAASTSRPGTPGEHVLAHVGRRPAGGSRAPPGGRPASPSPGGSGSCARRCRPRRRRGRRPARPRRGRRSTRCRRSRRACGRRPAGAARTAARRSGARPGTGSRARRRPRSSRAPATRRTSSRIAASTPVAPGNSASSAAATLASTPGGPATTSGRAPRRNWPSSRTNGTPPK